MVEFLFLRDIDAKMRELVGLYHAEKHRADELSQRVQELEDENRTLKSLEETALSKNHNRPASRFVTKLSHKKQVF